MYTPNNEPNTTTHGYQPSFLQIFAFITFVLFVAMIAIPFLGAVIQGASSDPTVGQGFMWIGLPIAFFIAPFFLISLVITIIAMFVSAFKDTKNKLQQKKEEPSIPKQKSALPPPPRTWDITPLFEAILANDIKKAHQEIERNSKQVNLIYAQNGNTPLHVAALNGYTEIVRLLLAQPGIDKTLKNNDGKTAQDLALEKGFAEIVELLK